MTPQGKWAAANRDRARQHCRDWYARNSEAQRLRVRSNSNRRRDLLNRFKRWRGCIDCGNNDFRVLDFDHRPGTDKLFSIGSTGGRLKPKSVLKAEIAKCDVRCSNCHRIVTYERQNGLRQS